MGSEAREGGAMRYDCEGNRPFSDAGCHVLDANGLEWFQVKEFDTETGLIVRDVTDADNNVLMDPETGGFVTEEVYAAAPLTFLKAGSIPADRRHRAKGFIYKGCTCLPPWHGFPTSGDVGWSESCPVAWAHERDAREVRELQARREARKS